MDFLRTRQILFLAVGCALSTATFDAYGQSLYSVAAIGTSSKNPQTRTYFSALNSAFDRLQAKAGTNAKLYFQDTPEINAFATSIRGKPIVVVNRGLLAAYGSDQDAVAAVLGHELGHVMHNHTAAQRSADAFFALVTGIAGLAIDINQSRKGHPERVGVGKQGAEIGSQLLSRSFTRDEEREADQESVKLLVRADIDPEAAYRSMSILKRYVGSANFTLFQTHPSTDERLINLRAEITSARPEYDHRQQTAAAEQRAKQEENLAIANAKAQEDASNWAKLKSSSSRTLAKHRESAANEEEALALTATGRDTDVHRGVEKSERPPECSAQSESRKTCTSINASGQRRVQRCERHGEDWECHDI